MATFSHRLLSSLSAFVEPLKEERRSPFDGHEAPQVEIAHRLQLYLLGTRKAANARVAAALALFLSVHFALFTSETRAEDLSIVTVSKSGPDREIPADRAYYLAGAVDESVRSVHPIYIRIGTQWLFSAIGKSCKDYAATLGAFKGNTAVLDTDLIGSDHYTRDLFHGAAGFDPNDEVFIVAPWKRDEQPADARKAFKILVPRDGFFAPSGRYCLFLYRTEETRRSLAPQAIAVLQTFSEGVLACKRHPAGPARAACTDAAKAIREHSLTDIKAPLADAAKARLNEAAAAAVGPLHNLHASIWNLDLLLETASLPNAASPAAGFTSPVAFDEIRGAQPPTGGDPFSLLLLSLLDSHSKIAREKAKQSFATTFGYWFVTRDLKTSVLQVQVLGDARSIRVSASAVGSKATQMVPLDAKTDELTFAGTDVTLRDILELTRGYVRLAGVYVSFSEVRRQLQAFISRPDEIPEDIVNRLRLLGERVEALARIIQRALAVSHNPADASADLGTQTASLRELGRWLTSQNILVPCSAAQMALWNRGGICAGVAPSWPGYSAPSNNPLQFVVGEVKRYLAAREEWPDRAEALATAVVTAKTVPWSVAETKTEFSQDTWVFSYLTPVVGIAFLTTPSDDFSLAYVGVQLHFVPNPVDEPLWTRRRDWMRSFALEVGMATGNGPWGPDKRFAGLKDIPPVLFGVALHPIPYTSFSAGGALLQKRSSTLESEKASAYVSWYVALNVQLNIPDLVVALKGRTSKTTTSN